MILFGILFKNKINKIFLQKFYAFWSRKLGENIKICHFWIMLSILCTFPQSKEPTVGYLQNRCGHVPGGLETKSNIVPK